MRSSRIVAMLSAAALVACASPQSASGTRSQAAPGSQPQASKGTAAGRSARPPVPAVRAVAERECQGTLIDSAMTPPGVAVQFKTLRNPEGDRMEIMEEAGCLVFELQMSITRVKRVWAVYEVLERFSDGGERIVKVVDPPGSPCPFPECDPAFDVAKLPSDCARERVGTVVEEISPADFPVKLEYQVIETNPEKMAAKDMWQEGGEGPGALVLETQFIETAQSIEKIKFCHKDLELLVAKDRFPCWLVVRLTPSKGGAATVAFSQNPLNRDAVTEALRQIEEGAPARRGP